MGKGRILLNTRSISYEVALTVTEVLTESALKAVYPNSDGKTVQIWPKLFFAFYSFVNQQSMTSQRKINHWGLQFNSVFFFSFPQDTEHKCSLVCGRKLNCGLHRCEEPCHRGSCQTCWQTSELRARVHYFLYIEIYSLNWSELD